MAVPAGVCVTSGCVCCGAQVTESGVDYTLDREHPGQYSFTLVAVDAGNPALSGSTNIRVRMTDVDDNSPVFERSAYHAVVPSLYRIILALF